MMEIYRNDFRILRISKTFKHAEYPCTYWRPKFSDAKTIRGADFKWIYLGCIIPDIPWIIQRLIRFALPNIDIYDLRLYAIVQASLFFCLLLSLTFATVSKYFWRTSIILSINVLFHLLLDASQIKWANGVHFFAPISWQQANFDLFWPESIPTFFLTGFGLICFVVFWRKSISPKDLLIPRSALRICLLVFLVAAYFVLPFFLLDRPESADTHFVKTLRGAKSRQGSYIEFDRIPYIPRNEGGKLVTFAGEEIGLEGMKLKHSATVSVRGRFIDNITVSITESHIHSGWLRDVASYTGLALIAIVWIVALLRKWQFIHDPKD